MELVSTLYDGTRRIVHITNFHELTNHPGMVGFDVDEYRPDWDQGIAVYLTPKQARKLAKKLRRLADSVQ
jgi:hypothetical protein